MYILGNNSVVRVVSVELLKIVSELAKAAPSLLAAGVFTSGLALVLPKELLDILGMSKFADDNRFWFGSTFVACLAILSAKAAAGWNASAKAGIAWKKRVKAIRKSLRSLTEDEKQILRFYFAKQTKTNTLRVDDGIVNGLVMNGIIYRSSSCAYGLVFPFNIDDEAWEYLNENPYLLGCEGASTLLYRTDNPMFG